MAPSASPCRQSPLRDRPGESTGTPADPPRRLVRRLLAMCWEFRRPCAEVLLYQVVALGLGLGSITVVGLGIDYLRAATTGAQASFSWPWFLGWMGPTDPFRVVALLGLGMAGMSTLRGWAAHGATLAMARLVHVRLVPHLQTQVYEKMQHLSFRFFDRNSSGTVINRVTGDIQAIRQFVEMVLIQSIILVMTLVIFTAYMLSIHLWLTVACLATLPILYGGCVLFSYLVRPEYLKGRVLFDRLILTLSETVRGIPLIKGFSMEPRVLERFQEANDAVRAQQKRIFWRVSVFSPSIDLLTQVNLAVLLLYGGWLFVHDEIALGTGLVVFAGLLQQFSAQVSSIAMIANSVQESLTGARRVFEVLDAPPGIESPPKALRPLRVRGAIEFQAVGFGFEPETPVLRDVSFKVEPGECIALVGATGSGKSALLSLIPRFYDPTCGRVTMDGHDLRRYDLRALRRSVGIVFQESFLFSDTVRGNIAFGRPDAALEQVHRAARIAAADKFIERLDQGYETVLGEYGVDLSGGQRQRLAIARAILLDPAVLILDDPTASIDPETEQEILDAINQAIAGRTTFIVAHRLSTLKRANRILVLDRGRLVQVGTHRELMAGEGPYREAALAQMLDPESRRLLAATPERGGQP